MDLKDLDIPAKRMQMTTPTSSIPTKLEILLPVDRADEIEKNNMTTENFSLWTYVRTVHHTFSLNSDWSDKAPKKFKIKVRDVLWTVEINDFYGLQINASPDMLSKKAALKAVIAADFRDGHRPKPGQALLRQSKGSKFATVVSTSCPNPNNSKAKLYLTVLYEEFDPK